MNQDLEAFNYRNLQNSYNYFKYNLKYLNKKFVKILYKNILNLFQLFVY